MSTWRRKQDIETPKSKVEQASPYGNSHYVYDSNLTIATTQQSTTDSTSGRSL